MNDLRRNTIGFMRQLPRILLFTVSLLICTTASAWHGGGFHGGGFHGGGYHGGGYYHGGGHYHGGGYYHGGYYGGYYGGPGIVVGVPFGRYYAPQCTIVQRCFPNGNCIRSRVCN